MKTMRPVKATSLTASFCVYGLPTASMTTSGPSPSVISCSRACRSSVAVLTTWWAPMRFAKASFSSSRSTAVTVAPLRLALTMAPMPIIPHPMTSTWSMSVTSARLTAWKPTLIGSMSAISFFVSPSAGMIFCHGMVRYSRMAPLRCTPSVWLCSQALARSWRHAAQCPQLL